MTIQILGSGCPKCKQLEQAARDAVAQSGLDAEVVKVSDIDDIMAMGVMMTPALAIDGDVKSVGKVLTSAQVLDILQAAR